MSAFNETLKKIFFAVDSFINSALKNESLGKTAEKERNKLLGVLQKFYAEYECFNPRNVDEGSSSSSKDAGQDESRNTIGSTHSNEEEAYTDDIPDTTVKSLTNPTKSAFLQKKRTELLGLFSKQKVYCVVHKNAMYWFKKPSDKKQQNSFFTTGYELREIPQTEKDVSKKEFPFELISTGKRTYQFIADSKEDLDSWKQAIATSSKFIVPVEKVSVLQEDMIDEDFGDVYEPIDEIALVVKRSMSQNNSKPLPDLPQTKSRVPELNDFDEPMDDDEEVYDEAMSVVNPVHAQSTPQLPSRNPQPPSTAELPPPASDLGNDTINDDEIYEFVDAAPNKNASLQPPAIPANNRSSVPSSPPPLPPLNKPTEEVAPPPLPSRGTAKSSEKPNKPLPSLPQKKRTLTLGNVDLTGEDYENCYYGIWKCLGSTESELSFDEGDIVHIINKELDSENWWVGELKGKIGLVPKPYLCQAYEVVVA